MRDPRRVDLEIDEVAVELHGVAVEQLAQGEHHLGRAAIAGPAGERLAGQVAGDDVDRQAAVACIWSIVASWRASWGTTSSPQRTASSMRSVVIGAIAAQNAVLSMPSW